jgi:hypothetical protein
MSKKKKDAGCRIRHYWNLLAQLNFLAAEWGRKIVIRGDDHPKNLGRETYPSQGEIYLAKKLLLGLEANLKLIVEGSRLNLKQFPSSDLETDRDVFTYLLLDLYTLEEDEDEEAAHLQPFLEEEAIQLERLENLKRLCGDGDEELEEK